MRNFPYFLIGMFGASLTGVLTIVGFLYFFSDAPEETPEKASTSVQIPNAAQPQQAEPSASAVPQQATVAQQASAPPQIRQVDSVPAALQYKISEWNAVSFYSGFIDRIVVDDEDRTAQQVIDLRRDSVITLTGWAGHSEFGMRTPTVLFSVCDTIVGVTTVQDPRPDVADNVHMNLTSAGWKATLAAEHLPQCENPVLVAWAQAPIGFNIFPLHGGRLLNMVGGEPPAFALTSRYRPPRHDERSLPTMKTIAVKANALRIRRCPTTDCAVVGQFTAGKYNGFVIERAGDWSLVQIDQQVGWVSESYLSIQ
ncbi:MAG: SH3 domain-containing protein [Pseudomonadota bacterium]|nr:SH3 domain-containing protein [Pseudomonadota bacterium]